MKITPIILTGLLLAACANSPSSIAPTAVDSDEYSHMSCEQMVTELVRVSDMLQEAEDDQNSAQTLDAITVLFVLVPASALAGDSEGKVAQFKGEKLALERAMEKNDC